ncbi:Anaphase-promoting complex subunit 23 [Cadophora gregata]|uniref:Anaphase-promoting complex subunit 23 n=1 Tax=Cadophora gregata TaxID=51156 RepID=UPI0026DD3B52|nr:Anaphase-promoting complex subunit 23 [Cadophora gregata]KAK0111589.1 Anaphase-promoting complex subunit 23 [Cadophora gregata]
MAKALFDCHEFQRCAAVFIPSTSSEHVFAMRTNSNSPAHGKVPPLTCKAMSQRALFLAGYALLIAGEKEKMEEVGQVLGPSDTGAIVNKQLAPIRKMLATWFNEAQQKSPKHGRSQGWLEYLYGLALAKDKNHDLAISWLLKSVSLYPWNWGAWQELTSLIRDGEHFKWVQSQLNPTIMAFIFSVHCRQELHLLSTSLVSEISQLQSIFPRSLFLDSQRALVFYRMKDLHEASSIFSKMLGYDPRHLDFIDHYSNILYKLGSRERLAFVAQLASTIDRYRPETCCVIGNYYSLSSRHEDAITHFRRALLLDRNFASAWTLLGHEYVKLENTHAAIDSYRHAVDINNKDYRAFVGLGQAYEVLEKPAFSLYYYRRAVALRPADMDLWQMMANCLQGMSRLPQAIDAVKKGIACARSHTENYSGGDLDTTCQRIELLFQLANLYEESQNRPHAIKCLEICLEESTAIEGSLDKTDETSKRIVTSILPSTRLLLEQWATANSE